jgi:hypothetical protein
MLLDVFELMVIYRMLFILEALAGWIQAREHGSGHLHHLVG